MFFYFSASTASQHRSVKIQQPYLDLPLKRPSENKKLKVNPSHHRVLKSAKAKSQQKTISDNIFMISLSLLLTFSLVVTTDFLLVFKLRLPFTDLSDTIVYPSGLPFSSTSVVIAKVKVELVSGRSFSCVHCSLLIFRVCCHPLSPQLLVVQAAGEF